MHLELWQYVIYDHTIGCYISYWWLLWCFSALNNSAKETVLSVALITVQSLLNSAWSWNCTFLHDGINFFICFFAPFMECCNHPYATMLHSSEDFGPGSSLFAVSGAFTCLWSAAVFVYNTHIGYLKGSSHVDCYCLYALFSLGDRTDRFCVMQRVRVFHVQPLLLLLTVCRSWVQIVYNSINLKWVLIGWYSCHIEPPEHHHPNII